MTQRSNFSLALQKLTAYRLTPGMRESLWGFGDQAVISATNFVLMVLLARDLGPRVFGNFVIAYTVLMFVNSIQASLFTQPYNVIGAVRSSQEIGIYTSSIAIVQLAFSMVTAIMIAAVGVILYWLGKDYWALVLMLGAAAASGQCQEFVRRVLYTRGAHATAFIGDIITYGGQVIIAVGFWRAGWLSPETALLAIAIPSIVGAIYGFGKLRALLFWPEKIGSIRTHWVENWLHGRWILGSSMVSWLSTQLFPIFTAGFVGAAATGGMRAAQVLLGPTHVLLKGVETMTPTRAARAHTLHGVPGLKSEIRAIAVPVGICMFLYCATIFVFAERIIAILLGSEFDKFAWFVRIYCLYYLLSFAITIISVSLRSLSNSFPLFHAQVSAAIVVLTFGVLAVRELELVGTALGLLASNVIVFVVLLQRLRATFQDSREQTMGSNMSPPQRIDHE